MHLANVVKSRTLYQHYANVIIDVLRHLRYINLYPTSLCYNVFVVAKLIRRLRINVP